MQFQINALLLACLVEQSMAFFRLPVGGSQSSLVERSDPIVTPGEVSGHVHSILGGNAFAQTMNNGTAESSTCTTAKVTVDKSNYWIPRLFYHDKAANTFTNVGNGGLLAYYMQRHNDNEPIVAFPAGFRMVAGNPMKRSNKYPEASNDVRASPLWDTLTFAQRQEALAQQAITWTCFTANGLVGNDDNGQKGKFPKGAACTSFRSELFFPSCWNGRDLDTPDHKSHVAYPDRTDNGVCPPGFPKRLPSLFFEHTWDTKALWNGQGEWPFVWAMGDPTGWGFHGDFLNGWDVNILQQAMDQCTAASGVLEDCQVFTSKNLIQSNQAADSCKLKPSVQETVQGRLKQLPGCNPIQAGPGDATMFTSANCPSGAIANPVVIGGSNITSTVPAASQSGTSTANATASAGSTASPSASSAAAGATSSPASPAATASPSTTSPSQAAGASITNSDSIETTPPGKKCRLV